MKLQFEFTEGEPLVRFLEANRGKLVEQKIFHFYFDCEMGAAFVLGDKILFLQYLWPSIIEGEAVDKEDVAFNEGMLWQRNYPDGHCEKRYLWRREDAGFLGGRILKIEVERFKDKHESFEGIRPEGGDYFGKIWVYTTKGNFFICAEEAMLDGFMSVAEK